MCGDHSLLYPLSYRTISHFNSASIIFYFLINFVLSRTNSHGPRHGATFPLGGAVGAVARGARLAYSTRYSISTIVRGVSLNERGVQYLRYTLSASLRCGRGLRCTPPHSGFGARGLRVTNSVCAHQLIHTSILARAKRSTDTVGST